MNLSDGGRATAMLMPDRSYIVTVQPTPQSSVGVISVHDQTDCTVIAAMLSTLASLTESLNRGNVPTVQEPDR